MKEISAFEIVGRAVSLYSSSFFHFITPFLVSGVVNGILSWYLDQFIPLDLDPTEFVPKIMPNLAAMAGLLASIGIGGWVVNVMASSIVVKSASDLLERENARLKESFYHVLGRILPLLIAGLVTGFLTLVGLLLFIVPGIIFIVMFSLVIPSIVIEGRGVLESFGRSRRLVSHHWGKTFVTQLLTFMISVFAMWAGGTINVPLEPLSSIIPIIVSAVVQPINPIAVTILYHSATVIESVPITRTDQTSTSFCSQCGYRLNPEDVYCPNCGKKK